MPITLDHSVLPLNKDNTIYHLHLHPEQLADTIIFVGDQNRVPMISQHFSKIECKQSHREFTTHTGYFNNNRVSVVSTGIGASNIDIVINEIDALKNIDFKQREIKDNKQSLIFCRIGTTGAFQPQLEPGQVIVSAYAAGFDGLLHFYQHTPTNPGLNQLITQHLSSDMLKHNLYTAACCPILLDNFSSLGTIGITLTAHGFYGAQHRGLRLPLAPISLLNALQKLVFNQIPFTNFEMETAMIYALSELLGHRAISINSVVYNRATQASCSNPRQAMHTLIERSLDLLTK